MSDTTTAPTPADVAPKVTPAQGEPATKTEEPDWKAEARKWEQRAKENKAAADRAAELEQAQMTEAEKAAQRLSAAEAEAATVPQKVTDALRTHLIDLHSIEADDAELFLTATTPDLLLKQVTRLVEAKGAGRKSSILAPREGDNPRPAGTDDRREFVRRLTGRD